MFYSFTQAKCKHLFISSSKMKQFLIKVLILVFPIWFVIVGLTVYISAYITPRISGDIGNLAFIPFGHEYNKYLQKHMLKEVFYQTIYPTDSLRNIHTDILSIGDSFSQLGKGGYQNYLCERGLSVINCYRYLYNSPIQYAYNILDENIVDSTNIQYLIVENVERGFEGTFVAFSPEKKEVPSGKLPTDNPSKKVKSVNEWSVARTRDYILYKIGIESPIYNSRLDTDLFSSDEANVLYFYHDDIEAGTTIKKNSEEKIKQVFEELKLKAEEKGITLILLVAVDKYDLYQNHIINNPWPKKTVNEDIERILGKSPNLLLSKHYITPLVEKGEKDVFMFNDTHWSYKASKIVADELYNRIEHFRSSK